MSWVDQYVQNKDKRTYGISDKMSGAPQDQGIYEMAAMENPEVASKGGDGGAGAASVATAGMTGAAVGGPVGAAIAAGGALATQYLAQKAADERARRDRAAQIEQSYSANQSNAYNSILNNLGRALR